MITGEEALERLKEGNRRFVSGQRRALGLSDGNRLAEVAKGQQPFAAILSCADSRVPPELIFDQGLGDLFVVRVAGNVAGITQIGSLEFAVEQLGARMVVVLGHARCGAVNAALRGVAGLSPALNSVVAPISEVVTSLRDAGSEPGAKEAIQANVLHAVDELTSNSSGLRERVEAESLHIRGVYYDLESGKVHFLESARA